MSEFYNRLHKIHAEDIGTKQIPQHTMSDSERIWNVMQTDTFFGQAATSLMYHNTAGESKDYDPVDGYLFQ